MKLRCCSSYVSSVTPPVSFDSSDFVQLERTSLTPLTPPNPMLFPAGELDSRNRQSLQGSSLRWHPSAPSIGTEDGLNFLQPAEWTWNEMLS